MSNCRIKMELYDWEKFWREWHNEKAETEADLYYQVAKTVNKEPMKAEIFHAINESIIKILHVTPQDNFVELCCGNGLCTYEFRDKAARIVAVDFSPHLIEAAKEFKGAPNITYVFENILTFLADFRKNWDFVPTKFLMNDSLAYFVPNQLEEIVNSIKTISDGQFTFLIRGIPNDDQKWNYYSKPEWKQRYLDNVAKGDITNDGLGRWWFPQEIMDICERAGVDCTIQNQSLPISNYRMDVLIKNK